MLGLFTRRCLNAAATAAASSSASSSAPPPATTTTGSNGGGGGYKHTASAVKRSTFAQPGLEGLRIAAYAPALDTDRDAAPQRRLPVAIGHVVAQLSTLVFAVDFKDSPPPSAVSLGSRVYVAYEREDDAAPPPTPSSTSQQNGSASSRGILMGGLVVRVNPNGTLGVLLDNHKVDLAVPQEKIAVTEGVCKFLSHPKYLQVAEWVRSAGLSDGDEVEGTACILYHNGWRAERLYLLEASDIRNMTHLSKSARMSLMEKVEWQRDHHRQMRQLLKERVKERDFRYKLTKYSGVVSASMAFLGIAFAFGWNLKNYHTQQRAHQLSVAAKTLTHTLNRKHTTLPEATAVVQHFVPRDREENAVRQVLHQLDTAHPRIIVFTGFYGCGKSTVCRNAVMKERVPAVYVDVRGSEDTLRSVVKALGVNNVEVCGDLLDFVAEACRMAKAANGETPLLMLKLREGSSLQRVYNDAVALACDRRLCHLVMEVPIESLTMANTGLPRLDFYMIPVFNREQAFAYTQHTIDPVSLNHFIDVIGTNSNDLDELFAAVHQRRMSASKYTNQKLHKAMRQLQATCANRPQLRAALQQLSAFAYEDGQHTGGDTTALRSAALSDIVLYDPVKDVWLFRNKLFHSASRCCWL